MELQQHIVEDIEKLITTGTAITTAVTQMKEFLSVPHTKLEITEYIKLYVSDKMFTNKDFGSIIVRLIPSSTGYNSRLLLEQLMWYGRSEFTIGTNFYIQYRKVIGDILKYMAVLDEEIAKLSYDDVVDRNIALRRAYLKLMTVIHSQFVVPVDVSGFPEMTFKEYEYISYMTETIVELQTRVEQDLWPVEDLGNLHRWDVEGGNWSNSDNTLKTLMNFVIYLGSLVRY